MRFFRTYLLAVLLAGWACVAQGADHAGAVGDAAKGPEAAAAHAEHGLPAAAPDVFHIGPLPVSNSMLVTWAVALLIIVSAQISMRRMREVPEGGQNFWEWLVESLYDFLEGIIGAELVKKTFWFFATIFIFILFSNWFGLIPGVGTVGRGHPSEHGFAVTEPWLRGVNADLNMTFGMAMVYFVMWTIWAFQANGVKGFFLHIFGAKGDMTGFLKYLMIVIFFAAGLIEVVTILFRPVTLSFRLYGNVFAGENMLEAMSTLVKEPAWLSAFCSVVVPLPFYFLEVLVGLVQALVFMLLTAVFTMLICQHDEEHGPGEAHH